MAQHRSLARRDRHPRLALVSLELDPIGAVVLRAVDFDAALIDD
jgi:hypothetical protein